MFSEGSRIQEIVKGKSSKSQAGGFSASYVLPGQPCNQPGDASSEGRIWSYHARKWLSSGSSSYHQG